ncbi:glycosyltransferase family 2 protein [Methylobacterium sp. A49B]
MFVAEDGFDLAQRDADAWRDDYRCIFESGQFDHTWYAARYPDVSYSGLPPLEHYVKYGARLGRRPRADFAIAAGDEGSAPFINPFAAWIRSLPSAPLKVDTPRVSVLCLVNEQGGFVRQTLEGILAQETTFPFELIVGGDRSTDGVGDIVDEYAARDPRVVPVLRSGNPGSDENFTDLTRHVRGRYVAVCGPHGHWTDPSKLQQQHDLLEARPEVSACFHAVRMVYEGLPGIDDIDPPECMEELTVEDLIRNNPIPIDSVLYRWRYGGPEAFDVPSPVALGSWYLHLAHAEIGRITYIPKVMALNRRPGGGIASNCGVTSDRRKDLGDAEIDVFRRLRPHFGGRFEAYCLTEQRAAFQRVAEAYLDEEDAPGLLKLIRANPDVAGPVLSDLGFDAKTAQAADAQALRTSLEAQSSVSVVVTAYNHAETIERCLSSVLTQRGFHRLQVVVGDDHSTDGSAAIIERLRASHPERVNVLPRPTKLGAQANLRDCLEACTGRFIAVCEGDDYWLSNRKLSKQLALLRRYPDADLCFSWVLLHHTASDTYLPHVEQGHLATGPVSFSALARAPLTANISCCLYRTTAVRGVPDEFYSNPSAADWLFNLYVADKGGVVFLRELLSTDTVPGEGHGSGLRDDLEEARIGLIRKGFSAIFGEGRGFEDLEVGCTVVPEEGTLPDTLRAHLETPRDRTWAAVEDPQITFAGWVLAAQPGQVTIIAETDGELHRYPMKVDRPDVISAVYGSTSTMIEEAQCGFCFILPYAPLLHVRLKIAFENEVYPWLSLMFTHRVIPKGSA